MKISIIHPSRGRPEQAFETAKRWFRDNSDTGNMEYILSIDESDPMCYSYKVFFAALTGTWFGDMIVITNDNHSAIEAINNAAKIATGDLFVVISDDFDSPEHWDTLLLEVVSGHSDFVLKTQDGIQKTLVTLPIMDRVYYERYGYVFEPGYSHMYSDQELTAVAAMTGRLMYSDLLFAHNHYTTGKSVHDEINKKNDATYPQGLAYFNERLKGNFGILHPVCSYESIVWH